MAFSILTTASAGTSRHWYGALRLSPRALAARAKAPRCDRSRAIPVSWASDMIVLSTTEQDRASNLLSDTGLCLLHAFQMTIGDIIRAARKKARLSQREMATELGVSHGAVAQWELDQTRPTNANMLALRVLLRIEQRDPSPSSPYAGEFVEDADELALLDFWRSLDIPDRTAAVKLLNIGGIRKTAK